MKREFGYYHKRGRVVKSRRTKSNQHISWKDMIRVYLRYTNFGEYKLNGNNCQNWVDAVWSPLLRVKINQEEE